MVNKGVIIIYLIFIILTMIFLIILDIYISSNVLQISNYVIKSTKLPKEFDGYKIVHLSDLHMKEFGKDNTKLIKKIDLIKPDAIFITGDMIYKKKYDFEMVFKLLENLVNKYSVYYVLGNHEIVLKHNILKLFNKKLNEIGVNLLLNTKTKINKNGESIIVYGVNFKFNMEPKKVKDILNSKYVKTFAKQVGDVDTSKYNVLLAHDPLNYELYDKFKFDLVFSGHVHGGAIRLFGRAILSPRRLLLPKYSSGVYFGKHGSMVVSRGLGSSTLKLRLFNRPEIVSVILKN